MVKYLGSKRTLVDRIVGLAQAFGGARSFLDLFSGTARVGHALKGAGFRVLSNDHNAYAATLARCYVQADNDARIVRWEALLGELNRLPGRAGYFTETFCERSRFFQPKNGARIDAIRERIAALSLDEETEAVALVSLMEAADRVDSTTGVQMAYLKSWASRANNDLELRLPRLLPRSPHGASRAYRMDALAAAAELEADIAYLDPPYNQHSYLGNYHIWESLVLWDKPAVYGTACKRADCRERKSAFNSRQRHAEAFRAVLARLNAKAVIVSFNDEGYLGRDSLVEMLSGLWGGDAEVSVTEVDYKRYVGAQIGIYNRSGEKVGKVGRLRNKELLYVASDRKAFGGAALARLA